MTINIWEERVYSTGFRRSQIRKKNISAVPLLTNIILCSVLQELVFFLFWGRIKYFFQI